MADTFDFVVVGGSQAFVTVVPLNPLFSTDDTHLPLSRVLHYSSAQTMS